MNTHQKSAGATITGLTGLLVLAALSVLGAGLAHAQASIAAMGAVAPDTSIGGPLPVDSTIFPSGPIIIGSFGRPNNLFTVIGGSAASLDDLLNEPPNITSADGTLTISGGATLESQGNAIIAQGPGSGTVTVTGSGSEWIVTDVHGDFALQLGRTGPGTGTLDISEGGKVTIPDFNADPTDNSPGDTVVGYDPGSKGVLKVTTGGILAGKSLLVGSEGLGTANISTGGNVMMQSLTMIGRFPSGSGTINVNSGGTLEVLAEPLPNFIARPPEPLVGGLFVGYGGTGILTIQTGGVVTVGGGTGTVNIAFNSGSTGTLNIGAPQDSSPMLPGTLKASAVVFGSGTGTINFNHTSPDYVFAPTISGPGVVNVLAGTTILTANNSYGGGTNISQKTTVPTTLAVGVPDSSDATVTAGSFALGTGDVSVVGGTLRTTSLLTGPSGIVTGIALPINVGGNYTQGPGGTLLLGIGGTQGEQYDHVDVAKSATLDATIEVASLKSAANPNGFHPSAGNEFEVLSTGGTVTVGGPLRLVDSAEFPFNITPGVSGHLELRPIFVEAKNAVVLVYAAEPPGEQLPTPPPGGSEEPPIVDDPGVTLPPVNPEAPIPPQVILPLLDPTAAQLTSLYQVSFTGAWLQRSSLDDRMFQLQQAYVPPPPPPPTLTGKEAIGKAPPPPPAPSTPCWGVWASGYGNWTHVGTSQGYHFDTAGMSAGVDYLLTPHWAVGLFGGYSHNWINFKSNGSADSDTGLGGLYTTYFDPTGWWVNAAVWGGGTSYSTSRQAVLGPANGDTNGWLISTYGEAGYDLHCGQLAYGPFVTMAYTDTQVNGFTEHGSLVPLAIHEDSQDSLITDVGGRLYYDWRLNQMAVIPQLKLAWEHEYLYSSLPITASAPALGGATAVFHGPSIGHDSLVINAGVLWQVNPRIAITVSYDGQLARDHYYSNGVDGVFSYSF